MRILDMRRKGAREVRALPQIKGLPIIGTGSFATVYDRGNTVFKLTADQFQYDFYVAGFDNPAFPKVLADYGKVGEVGGMPVYLLEMEKLNKIEAGTGAKSFVESFLFRYWISYPTHDTEVSEVQCCAEALMNMADMESFSTRLSGGLLDMAGFMIEKNCVADFHAGNFMLRGHQVVLNDPVADSYASPL